MYLEQLELKHKEDVLNELKKGVLNDNITCTLEQVAKEISDAIKALK